MLPGVQRTQQLTIEGSKEGDKRLGKESHDQNYFIKIIFCELNIVGMVCWTNICQKIKNKITASLP